MTKTVETIYKNIHKVIENSTNILITSHSAPDGDSLGSQLVLYDYIKSFDKDVNIINEGTVPYMYRFLPGIERVMSIDKHHGDKRYDLAFVLDCSSNDRIGEVKQVIDDKTYLVNIDHHPDNQRFGDIALINDKASSVAEILMEWFLTTTFHIDHNQAALLYTAIMTDTGRFRFESTGRRTMELVGYLIEAGAQPRSLCDNVYFSVSPSILKLTGKMIGGAGFYEDNKICLMELNQGTMKKYGADLSDLDSLAEYTLYGRDVRVGALLKELDNNEIKVSLRSRDSIDVSRVAHEFGGGGHYNASGFVISLPLEATRKKLLDCLKGLIND